MRILIAYDGSSHADAAVSDLELAGMPAAGEARVLTIADVILPPPLVGRLIEGEPEPPSLRQAPARAVTALRAALDTARKGAMAVRAALPGWKVTAIADADEAAWGVIKECDVWQPDLVVVGSQGHAAVSRMVLGSVSHKVLTEGRCNVRIARPWAGSGRDRARLILGVDGSAGSSRVLAAVAARHWPAGSEALLVSAVDTRLALAPPNAFEDELHASRKMLAHAAASLKASAPGLEVTTLVGEGDPKTLLLERAKAWGATSIFVGARGLSATERIVLGSVSTAMAMRARCSVEVVHGPREHGASE
jgi:nucleotide-binding universal stress UspA family protein